LMLAASQNVASNGRSAQAAECQQDGRADCFQEGLPW
jgi:hypothetical protein